MSLTGVDWAAHYEPRFSFRHVPITLGAFAPHNERAIGGFRAYCDGRVADPDLRRILDFACLAVLESVSYTRKDGQYLRWDHRARRRGRSSFDKGVIPDFGSALDAKLQTIARDTDRSDCDSTPDRSDCVVLREGSCLDVLPELEAQSVDMVITSPPYCNRYDYMRTHVLELAYCGLTADRVKNLRQQRLFCTVENRDKCDQMFEACRQRVDEVAFRKVQAVFGTHPVLHEVLGNIERLADAGQLNNANVPRMVRNYFLKCALRSNNSGAWYDRVDVSSWSMTTCATADRKSRWT